MCDRNTAFSPGPTLVGRLLDPDCRDAALADLTGQRVARTELRGLVVLAAHGGAGATTVATFLDPGQSGWAIEAPTGRDGIPAGRRVVLVSRSTAYGLAATARTLAAWSPRLVWPWLVLVADAPVTPPLPVLYRLPRCATSLPGWPRCPTCTGCGRATAQPRR